MEVYLVYYQEAYEVDQVVGVFSDYVKAREYELEYRRKYEVNDEYGWCVIRKVGVDQVYDVYGSGLGVEV
mgnify:CR=1 FL=1